MPVAGSPRRWKWAINLVGALIVLLGIFALAPGTFEQEPYSDSKVAHRMGSYDVVRTGHSRLSQKYFEDGPSFGGHGFQGRCFVDYREGGRVVRQFGWRMRVRNYYTGEPIRVDHVEIKIE